MSRVIPTEVVEAMAEYLMERVLLEDPASRHYFFRKWQRYAHLIVQRCMPSLIAGISPRAVTGLIVTFANKASVPLQSKALGSFAEGGKDRKNTVKLLADILLQIQILPFLWFEKNQRFLENEKGGEKLEEVDYDFLVRIDKNSDCQGNFKWFLIDQMKEFRIFMRNRVDPAVIVDEVWPFSTANYLWRAEIQEALRQNKNLYIPKKLDAWRKKKDTGVKTTKVDLSTIFEEEYDEVDEGFCCAVEPTLDEGDGSGTSEHCCCNSANNDEVVN